MSRPLCRIFFIVISVCYRSSESFTLPYLTFGVGRLLHLPSAEAISVRPNAQPRCNQKVTVIGCEAETLAVRPKSAVKANKSPATWDWWRVVWLFLSGGLRLVSSSPSDKNCPGHQCISPTTVTRWQTMVGVLRVSQLVSQFSFCIVPCYHRRISLDGSHHNNSIVCWAWLVLEWVPVCRWLNHFSI